MATEDDMKLGLDVGVEVHGEESLDTLAKQLSTLGRRISQINAGLAAAARGVPAPGKATTPDTGATRGSKTASATYGFDRTALAAFKQRMSLQGRMAAQQLRQEREAFALYRAKTAFQAKADAADVRAIKAKAAEDAKSFRSRLTFNSRLIRQRQAEERSAARDASRSVAAAAKAENKRLRDIASAARIAARTEIAETRRVDREKAAALRNQIAGHRYLIGLHDRTERAEARQRQAARADAVRHRSEATRHGSDAYHRLARPGPVVAAVAAATGGAAIRRGVSSRMDTDGAETGLRIFGSEPASRKGPGSTMTQDQVERMRSEWMNAAALANGMSPADAIRAHTEVLKAGVAPEKARDVTTTLMGAVAGMDLELKDLSRIAGMVMTNRPDLDVKSWANSFAIAAGTTAADPQQIMEGYKRGMGVFSGSNMTPEDLTAFIATGAGAGIQAGKTGNFISETASTLMNAGSERGQRRKDLNLAASKLGFGSASGLSSAAAGDMSGTLVTVFERMKAMDEKTRARIAKLMGGREWDDEELQMVNSVETLKDVRSAIHDRRNSGYLDKAKSEKMQSWGGMWAKTKSVFSLFWEKFGAGFDDLFRAVNQTFEGIGKSFDFGKISRLVQSAVEGIKTGLGLNSWREGLESVFSGMRGADFNAIAASVRDFLEGFVQSIREFAASVKRFFSVFGGGDASAETMGRWTGRILSLSVSLAMLRPVLSVLGGLASIILAIAAAGRGLAGLAGLGAGAATAGAAGIGAGLLKGLGLALSRMFALSVVAEIGANRGSISTWMLDGAKSLLSAVVDGIKSAFTPESIRAAMKAIVSEVVPAPVQRWLNADGKLQEKNGLGSKTLEGIGKPPVTTSPQSPSAPTPTSPAAPSLLGRTWDWLMSSLIGSANANEVIPPPPRPGMPGAPGVPGLPGQPGLSTFVAIETRPVSPVSPITVPTIARPTTSDFTTPAPLGSIIGTETGQQPPLGLPGLPGQPGAPGLVSIIEVAPRPIASAAPVMTPAIRQSTTPATTEIAANDNARFIDAIRDNTKALRANLEPKVSKLSDFVSRTTTNNYAVSDSVRSAAIDPAARVQQAALPFSSGTGGGGFGPSPLSGSIPGSAMAPGGGRLSSRGIIGGVGSVPGAGPGMGPTPGGIGGGFGGAPAGAVSGRMKSVYDGFRAAGLSHEAAKSFTAEIGRENDYNPNVMFGSHIDPHNRKRNAGMMSWQGDRAENLMAKLREGGHVNPDGSIKRTQEAVNAQAKFAVDEMKNGALGPRGQRALGVLNNPNATHADRALALGDDVIKWRQHDPRYASHAQKRDGYYNQMEGVSKGVTGQVAGLGTGRVPGGGVAEGWSSAVAG